MLAVHWCFLKCAVDCGNLALFVIRHPQNIMAYSPLFFKISNTKILGVDEFRARLESREGSTVLNFHSVRAT